MHLTTWLTENKLALCLAALLVCQYLNANYQPVAAKMKTIHRHSATPLKVPPPPMYFPSLAEETDFYQGSEQVKPKKNPYAKYVRYPDGHTDPAPLKPNKYVTYWNKS
jgi:hypothetical protein